jgi:hypothetical protein
MVIVLLAIVIAIVAVTVGLAVLDRPRSVVHGADDPRRGTHVVTGTGGLSSDGPSGGYDANMNGPYGNSAEYPSSWHGPNEPGGSFDI